MKSLVPWVAAGGALGATARHWIDLAMPATSGFPWGTLMINLTGSLVLALLPTIGWLRGRSWAPAFVGTGVLGGFTTMSAFAEQTRTLIDSGHLVTATVYVAASVLGALVLVSLASSYVERVGGHEEEPT